MKLEITALWGNDDAESRIKISKNKWKQIELGKRFHSSAWAWYEGVRFRVDWWIEDKKCTITGPDGLQAMVDSPLNTLLVSETE